MQQTVFDDRLADLNTICQDKCALELARGNAAMQEYPAIAFVTLAPANDQLPVLNGDCQIAFGKTCHRKRDAVGHVRGLFDIKGRIAVVAGLGGPLKEAFKLLKPE